MFSSSAAFPADVNEQLEYSSLNPPIWSSYDPTFTPSSGVYVNNYWNEYYYAPVYYEQQHFADFYQPVNYQSPVYYGFYEFPVTTYFVPVYYYPVIATYTATFIHTPDVLSGYDDEHDISYVNDFGYETFENNFSDFYQPVYYQSPVYYGFYVYPVTTYFVPVFYYPVSATETLVDTPDVPPEYDDEHNISYANDFGYASCENRDVSVNNYAEKEICSEARTSLVMYYEEPGERLNNAPFKDDKDNKDEEDDKDENKDDDSTSCQSEAKSKECLEDVDLNKEHALLDLCAEFMKHSLPDNKKNSSSSEEDFSSDGESSSSDSDDDDFTNLKRHGNFTDLQHPYDSPQSASSQRLKNFVVRGIDAHSSSDIKFCRKVPDNRGKHGISDFSISSAIRDDKSDVTSGVHADSGKSFMDIILASEEYLGIQDHLENTKLYRDHCYKLSLKKNPRRKEAVLLDVLPTLIEESPSLENVTDEPSVDDAYRTGNQEVVSHNEQEPVIRKMKQPKRRFKAIRKWFSKTFCCCCTSKDPP